MILYANRYLVTKGEVYEKNYTFFIVINDACIIWRGGCREQDDPRTGNKFTDKDKITLAKFIEECDTAGKFSKSSLRELSSEHGFTKKQARKLCRVHIGRHGRTNTKTIIQTDSM
jgi:hypothetical protein